MPRPERPLGPDTDPIALFAAELRELRRRAGNPGYRELAARSGYSAATLSIAAAGRRLPTLPVTTAFVQACGGGAEAWERRWRQAAAESAAWQTAAPDEPGQDSPYRGLRSYGVEDADRFFGRERLVERVVDMLRRHRFVALFGASGSGKSSLLGAGVIPALCTGGTTHPVLMTPGEAPARALRAALAQGPPDGALILVVDQFEELFTLCPDGERLEFVAALADLAADPGGRTRVVIAGRADFYAHCSELPRLAELLAGANVPVGPLSAEELHEVITRPARGAGLTVERALVAKLVADAAGQPGALPLVSHALLETWRQRRANVLTVAGYDAAGGIAGAVAQTAESVYQRLAPHQRDTAREVLTRLVTLGEGVADTRRRAARAELDFPDADRVLRDLAAARLIVIEADSVAIAHEALVEAWPRLYGWLHDDRQQLLDQRAVTDAAVAWERLDRDPDALYRGIRLAAWSDRHLTGLNALEREFLAASRERAARSVATGRRRRRLAFTGLVSGVVITAVLAVLALAQAHRAERERDLAVSRQLVAYAREQAQVDQELALMLAARAYDRRPTEDAVAALRQSVLDSRVRAVVPTGHGRTFGVAFSPGGDRLATSGEDGSVRLWQVTGADRVADPKVLRGHEGDVWSPAFSPDGRWLAACGVDGTVTIWDLTGGGAPVRLRGHSGVVSHVAFSADGGRVASVGADGTVRIWPRDGRRPPRVLTVPNTPFAVAFSPDGRQLAAAGTNVVWLWDAAGARPPVELRASGSTEQLAFSPDGRQLAGGGSDGTVRIWTVGSAADPLVLRGNDGYVESVAFSRDGRRVASGHSDGGNTIRIWSTTGTGEPTVLRGHSGPVWSIAFSPDGRRLSSVSSDATLRLWDATYPGDPLLLRGHSGPVWGVAASADGQRVASAGQDGTARVWDQSRPDTPLVLRGHTGEVLAVAMSADGRRAATAGEDGSVRIWDAETGAAIATRTGHEGVAIGVAMSGDGRLVASAGADATVRVWDTTAAGTPVVLRGHRGVVRALALSGDGRLVGSAGADGTVRVWPADGSGDARVLRDGPVGLIWTVAFSPDGRRLAAGGHDGLLRIWPVGGGVPVVLRGHQGNVWSAAFSPDGRLLASAGQNGGVRIWDTRTGRQLVEIRGHASSIEQVMFTAGPHRLITAHGDGTVRVWTCPVCGPPPEVRDLARGRAIRPPDAADLTTFLEPPA